MPWPSTTDERDTAQRNSRRRADGIRRTWRNGASRSWQDANFPGTMARWIRREASMPCTMLAPEEFIGAMAVLMRGTSRRGTLDTDRTEYGERGGTA